MTKRSVRLNRLEPNTSYNYVITASAADGRKYRYFGKFNTLNRTVKVTLERLSVNSVKRGQLKFFFAVHNDWLRDQEGWVIQYPGGDGQVVNLFNQTWADIDVHSVVDAAPGSLHVAVLGVDHHPTGQSGVLRSFGEACYTGRVRGEGDPAGSYFLQSSTGSSQACTWSTAYDEVDTSANDADRPGVYPFKLRTGQGGSLMFEVSGRIEVTYSDQPSAQPRSPVRTNVSDGLKTGGVLIRR
ncbi:MAG: hypothetical protein EHM61_26830 [Acidobacteria bacterium]|nr:MAG: hypothetical protein EHM61_26830 [Acidobacteriota bacterium]